MKCCNENNSNNSKGKKKNPMKHMLMMALCCGLPILILAIVPFLGSGNAALKTLLISIAPFICPLMMIGMIPMMFMHSKDGSASKGGHGCCGNDKVEEENIEKLKDIKVNVNELEN
ncbi:MAG: hypothetical protein RR128_10335 [Clostridium sp.]